MPYHTGQSETALLQGLIPVLHKHSDFKREFRAKVVEYPELHIEHIDDPERLFHDPSANMLPLMNQLATLVASQR